MKMKMSSNSDSQLTARTEEMSTAMMRCRLCQLRARRNKRSKRNARSTDK
jgi:hypothetical protein